MKDKLLADLKDPKGKLICIDLDGTLTTGECWSLNDVSLPVQPMIDYVNRLYCKGGHIIIWTARPSEFFQMTHAWLVKHSVSYHGIAMKYKPNADIYIDNKALNVEDILLTDTN